LTSLPVIFVERADPGPYGFEEPNVVNSVTM
jgi:hypothetical protein